MLFSFPLYILVKSIFTTVPIASVMSPLIHYQPSWILPPEPGNCTKAFTPVQYNLFCDQFDALCLSDRAKLISECKPMP